jgi:hypothetical protein
MMHMKGPKTCLISLFNLNAAVQSEKLVIPTCYCHEVSISDIQFLHYPTKVKEVNSSVLSILFIPLVF